MNTTPTLGSNPGRPGRYLPPDTYHALVALAGLAADTLATAQALRMGIAELLASAPTKKCAHCGVAFKPGHPRQRYHTEACRNKARNYRRREAYDERTHPEEAEA